MLGSVLVHGMQPWPQAGCLLQQLSSGPGCGRLAWLARLRWLSACLPGQLLPGGAALECELELELELQSESKWLVC